VAVNESTNAAKDDAGLFGPTDMQSLGLRLGGLVNGCFGTHRGLLRLLLGEAEFLLGRLDPFLVPDLTRTRRLVFVCLGNINRSAFAEKVANGMGLDTTSIGLSTSTGAPAFEMAVTTARRFGVDLTSHIATDIVDYAYMDGDLLLAMEVRHAHRLVQHGIPREAIALLGHWASPHRIHIHDPHTLSEAYFRTCFSIVHSAIRELAIDCRGRGSPCLRP
jgi:protein-tyrosine phosphatase